MITAPFPNMTDALVEQIPIDHDVDRSVAVHPLKISESATFLVDGLAEVPRVVRVYRSGRHGHARIISELQWINALTAEGFPTPAIIPTRDGQLCGTLACHDGVSRIYVLFEYVAPDVEPPGLNEHFRAIGELAGRLQCHTRRWDRPAGFDRPRWDLAATMAPDTDWGSWPAMRLPDSERALLKRARHQVISQLPPFDAAHVQLVHADLKPVNSIWNSGRLLAIDFDDSGFAWPLFDLAASLTLFEADSALAGYVEQWLAGFESSISLSDNDLAVIPTFIMQRRLMILGWLNAHPDADSVVNLAETLEGTLEVSERYLSRSLL